MRVSLGVPGSAAVRDAARAVPDGLASSRSAPAAPAQQMDPEYAKLVGATASQGKSAMPGPLEVGATLWEHIKDPFYDKGPNDKGVGIQLAYSIARVLAGLSAGGAGRDAASAS